MHPSRAFHLADAESVLAFFDEHPFAVIAASVGGRLVAAHAPVLVNRLAERGEILFHLGRANAVAAALADGRRALAVSTGPHAYVSPDWYGAEDQVPTWNYLSAEAEGPVAPMDDVELTALLDALSARSEGPLAPKRPWTTAKMSPGVFERMRAAVIGFRLTPERLEGVRKLSQNKPEEVRVRVVDALAQSPDPGARSVADEMRALATEMGAHGS